MEKPAVDRAVKAFRTSFDGTPRLFRAPGRVNLIGEHTDYNEGFVLPFAINLETVVAGRAREDLKYNIVAVDVEESFSFALSEAAVKRRGNWIDYVEGTIRCLHDDVGLSRGADIAFSSTVPIGGGLSSSAALEVSNGYSVLALNDLEVDRKQLAFASQRAEHEFVGIRSGIMDQFTSVFGRADNALLLDCRSLAIEYIPLRLGDAVLTVCDTNVKHELASSEYNLRREQCEKAVEILGSRRQGIKSLRDVSRADLDEFGPELPEVVFRRCRHVVTENERTTVTADALRRSDLETAGQMMFASHFSLRDDYEVSSPELDFLVEVAGSVDGVYGARMTGGGFGGCTVNLLERASAEEFNSIVNREYEKRFGAKPSIYTFNASDGASEIA